MPMLNKKHFLAAAALASIGAAGCVVGFMSGDPVVETEITMRQAPQPVPPTALRPTEAQYLGELPEPPREVASKPRPKVELPAAKAEPVQALATQVIAQSDCSASARPLGDCDCFDEKIGKVSLRLHPSKSCVDEESKRLGHKLALSDGAGGFELAGVESAPKDTAPAEEIQPSVQKRIRTVHLEAALAPAPDRAPASADLPQEKELVEFIPVQKSSSLPTPRSIQLRPPPPLLPTGEGVGNFCKAMISLPRGSCPAGSKNETCRCVIFNANGSSRVVLAAGAPDYCSLPALKNAPMTHDGNFTSMLFAIQHDLFCKK